MNSLLAAQVVANHCAIMGLNVEDVRGTGRAAPLCECRRRIWHELRYSHGFKFAFCGTVLRRDHTTAMAGLKCYEYAPHQTPWEYNEIARRKEWFEARADGPPKKAPRAPGTALPTATKEKIRTLRSEGVPQWAVAERLGCSRASVQRHEGMAASL